MIVAMSAGLLLGAWQTRAKRMGNANNGAFRVVYDLVFVLICITMGSLAGGTVGTFGSTPVVLWIVAMTASVVWILPASSGSLLPIGAVIVLGATCLKIMGNVFEYTYIRDYSWMEREIKEAVFPEVAQKLR
jgi:hypothetical protein